MSETPPFISVIIPVYNGELYIQEAIESVFKQNYTPLEIIVIDDGSTDQTARVIKQLVGSVTYVFQPNAGPAAARNRGLAIAQGEIIAFLDADDIWTDNKLDLQISYLLTHPECDLVMGRTVWFSTNEDKDNNANQLTWKLDCALFRRHVFEKVGRFDQSLILHEDMHWFWRALTQGIKIDFLDNTCIYYRRHQNNLTNDRSKLKKFMMQCLRKFLEWKQTIKNAESQH